ncbi:MAG TPA: nitrous oxide reductase family maturation protein NosD, partial [Acidobacteriota bacterium]|nr:nitrous oxide reductase family maturation protein NosD [Acidobacteriota bacterium]
GILLKSDRNRIESNELRDVLFGIYLFQSDENLIRGQSIYGRSYLESGERGSGIHLWSSGNNVIEKNTISQTRDGLFLQNSNHNKIRDNQISNLRYGVHYMFSDSNIFENNIFSDSLAGAAIMYSRQIEFRRNLFLHNRGFSSFGILLQECEQCVAEENVILDNGVGIFMEALRKSTIRANVIAQNDIAIEMFGSVDGNRIEDNNFVDNLSPLQLIGRSTNTRWSNNFWSDYDGYDLDGDGKGDIPHKIQNVFEYLEGNYPRLRIYLYSAAAHALASAEKAFPVLQFSSEIDPNPSMRSVLAGVPEGATRPRSSHLPTALFSLAMLTSGIVLFWRGQS